MSPLEIAAALLGLANIILLVRRSVWNYPFAIVMVALYAQLFWRHRLYSDALLQAFFVVVNLYGWWAWTRHRGAAGAVVVRTMTLRQRLAWAAGTGAAVLAWGAVEARVTDAAVPWADAAITGMSVAAQIMLARRWIENWWLWIAADLLSLAIYPLKGLLLTTALYALFLAMSVWGLQEWHRSRREAR